MTSSVKIKLDTVSSYYALCNRVHFFLNHVLILVSIKNTTPSYRLIVFHNNEKLTDEKYTTLRGAIIAFSRLYLPRSFCYKTKAKWSKEIFKGDLSILLPKLPLLLSLEDE